MNKDKGLKLTAKLNLFLIPIIMVIIAALLIIIYTRVYSGIYEQQKDNITQSVYNYKETFEIIVNNIKTIVRSTAHRNIIKTELLNNNYTQSREIVRIIKKDQQFYEDALLSNKNGIVVASNQDIIGMDLKDFDFWNDIKSSNGVYIQQKPFQSPVTGHIVFMVAMPVYNGNTFIGAFMIPVDLTAIGDNIILNKKYGKDGYAFAVDLEGDTLVHPDESIIMKNIDVMDTAVQSSNESGFYGYMWEGRKKYMAFVKFDDPGLIVSASIYEDDLLSLSVSILTLLSIIGAVAVVIFVVAIFIITRRLLISPLNKVVGELKTLSEGGLTSSRLDVKSKDEIRSLADSTNFLKDFLYKTINQINLSVEQLTEGSRQVAESSQMLSEGSSKQAASLEEITASINEIASQIQQNTENIRRTNNIAEDTKNKANKGNDQMKELVGAMSKINNSADDIRNIVGVIDEIAFQTNLLALNADIEAERVGKYGRGFAVVANSVRTLAGRSAEAVKDTKAMIEDVIKNIENGNNLVKLTSQQLEEITSDASQVSTLTEEISGASQEQANGIEQISTGINQIEDVTQSNSANAEENAAASEELSSQSRALQELMEYFTVIDDDSTSTTTKNKYLQNGSENYYNGNNKYTVERNNNNTKPIKGLTTKQE